MNNHDRWENHIDFRPATGNPAALLAEFKQYIQWVNTDSRHPMRLRYKAWLWGKGIITLPAKFRD